jgi:hypothetical protein
MNIENNGILSSSDINEQQRKQQEKERKIKILEEKLKRVKV